MHLVCRGAEKGTGLGGAQSDRGMMARYAYRRSIGLGFVTFVRALF
jgi:hypothetical protein